MGGEKTLPRAIIGVWNKKNRCGIKRLPSEESFIITFWVTGNTAIGETREDLLEEGGLENITSYIPEELVEFILADNKVSQAFDTFDW